MTTKEKETAGQAKKNSITHAKAQVHSMISAASTIKILSSKQDLDFSTLVDELSKRLDSIDEGKTATLESMLLSQAQVLQVLFHFAAARISVCNGMLPALQTFSDMAFKANNACRKTLLAINHIKHPSPATFVKQQNNAVNQQINNETVSSKNFEKNIKPENELLLEAKPNETLDFRRPKETIAVNKKLETVGKIDGG